MSFGDREGNLKETGDWPPEELNPQDERILGIVNGEQNSFKCELHPQRRQVRDPVIDWCLGESSCRDVLTEGFS